MATEKILIFDEAGNAKRMKVRIARFLDNEPVTATDKENIRTTLDVDGSQSGTFTTPLSVTSASDSSFTGGGKVGIGASPSYDLHVTNASTSSSIGITGSGGSKDTWTVTSTDSGGKALLNFRDEDTANTVMSLHQDGKVGVNQTSPGSYNSNANNLVVGSGSGSEGLTIATGTTGEGGIYFADGTTGNQQYRGYAVYQHATDQLVFGSGGNNRWYINSSGDLKAWSSGTINVGSGGAIDFGSAAGGTGTPHANGGLLSDYESGTFTPTDGSGAGLTFSSAYGKYVKVGDQVTAWVRVLYPTTSDSTAASIQGFPFAFGGGDNVDRVGGAVAYTGFGEYLSFLGVGSASQVQIFKTTGSGPTNANMSGQNVWFFVTYNVS